MERQPNLKTGDGSSIDPRVLVLVSVVGGVAWATLVGFVVDVAGLNPFTGSNARTGLYMTSLLVGLFTGWCGLLGCYRILLYLCTLFFLVAAVIDRGGEYAVLSIVALPIIVGQEFLLSRLSPRSDQPAEAEATGDAPSTQPRVCSQCQTVNHPSLGNCRRCQASLRTSEGPSA